MEEEEEEEEKTGTSVWSTFTTLPLILGRCVITDHGVGEDEEIPSLVDVYDIAVDIGKVSGEQKGPQTIFFSSSGIQNLSFSNNLWMFDMDKDADSNIGDARMKPNMNI